MATLTPVEQRMIDHFVERVKDSKLNPRIDNASLCAGSPMYYYCGECGAFITSLPECHSGPAPHTCNSCKKLEDGELMVEARKAAEASEKAEKAAAKKTTSKKPAASQRGPKARRRTAART